MSMHDAIAGAIGPMRDRAEALMTDTCTIERPGDEATDAEGRVTTPMTQTYAGPCKIQTFLPNEQRPEVGSSTPVVQRSSVHLPHGTEVQPGDVVTVTSSAQQPGLVGRKLRAAYLAPFKTWATATRVYVDEGTTTGGA